MASEDQDDAQKTEEPTQKKLDDAHKKGDVAKSQEINHWFMIIGAALAILMFSADTMNALRITLGGFLRTAHLMPISPEGAIGLMERTAGEILNALFLPLLVLFVAAIAGNIIQHKPVFTAERMKPKFSKLSLLKGFKRMFSVKALVDFAKGILKLTIVATVVTWMLFPEWSRLDQLMTLGFTDLLLLLRDLTLRLLLGVVMIMAFIAAADLMFQKQQTNKRLRMSKQDIKDELKQSEGDPIIRARIRQLRQERSRRRMMAAVPEADVVITNPTHYSIALKYDFETMNAPVLVAKGVDRIAQRIREVAEENDVPQVENPPLARALYATVEIDQEIPAEHFKAVAEVIGFIMRLKGKTISPAAADGGQ